MACMDCDEDLEHCHGVVVRHSDGRCECVDDPGCAGAEPAHGWVVGCAEVGCPCREQGTPSAPLLAA